MKKIFLYTAFFSVVFFSCKKTTVDKPAEDKTYASSAPINKNDNAAYKEVFDVKKSSDYNEKNEVKKLDLIYKSLLIKIRYISDRAYISLQNENNKLFDWKPLQMNFYYDMSFADAEKDIHLLLKNDDTSGGYLVLPAFTEQFSTYFVYHFEKGTLNYIGNYEFLDFGKGSFSFDEKSRELSVLSSDSVKKLNKIKDTEIEKFNNVGEDIQLLSGNSDKKSTGNFSQYINNKDYFIKTFDVNKDGVTDKIVSQNRFMGDEILVFLGDKSNNYNLALKSTNFSEDGGNQITDIKETSEGYEIITQFPDRGYVQNSYFVSGKGNQFVLKKIKTESDSWQNNYRENCVQDINFNLKKSLQELYETISKTKKNCTKTSGINIK